METTTNHKKSSIIIPALNEEKFIGKCLESIIHLKTPPDNYEVIIVDNGSTDKTIDIAESFKNHFSLKIITIKNATISALRNSGVKASIGDILAFIDADCTVSEDWLKNAIKYFEDPIIGAVGASHYIPEGSSWVANAWDLIIQRKRLFGEVESLPSGNLLIPKKHFLKINGFDENLITNEDYELCYRLRKIGLRIYSDPNIKAIHWGIPNNLLAFYKQQKWHGTHVVKVFIDNFKELNTLSGILKFKAILYSLYYLIFILTFLFGMFLFLCNGDLFLIGISFLGLFIIPLLLSMRIMDKSNASFGNFIKLIILYFIYGIARAQSLINPRNWL